LPLPTFPQAFSVPECLFLFPVEALPHTSFTEFNPMQQQHEIDAAKKAIEAKIGHLEEFVLNATKPTGNGTIKDISYTAT
jgi:hypothetical protein